jgi:hypothetical protein
MSRVIKYVVFMLSIHFASFHEFSLRINIFQAAKNLLVLKIFVCTRKKWRKNIDFV